MVSRNQGFGSTKHKSNTECSKLGKTEGVWNSAQRDAPELSTLPLRRKFSADPENRHESARNEKNVGKIPKRNEWRNPDRAFHNH